MQIKVTQNEVKINKDILNDGEYNIHKCQFDFDEEYNGLVQKAVFTLNDGTSYLETIVNNECNIPIEVLEEGVLKIGVYAYETNNDELVLRYSPSPDIIHVFDGSYVKDAQNSEGGTPTEYEQLESRVNTALNEIDEALDNVETAVNEANNLDVDVSKTGKVATIDVTKKNGTVKTVTLSDGTSLQFKWEGTSLGIKTDNEESYTYVDLEGPQGKQGIQGPQGEEGKTGPQGETGATGNGIISITKTSTSGLVDTYTITFTNGNTTTFDVTNGQDGEVTQKQLDETNENVSWLQTLTEQMPHVSGQGTDLSLESVLNYRLMKFLPQGVSSQESTTGKNLCNGTSKHYFASSSGVITNAGTNAYLSIPHKIKVEPNTQYTIKFYGYESYTSGVYLAEYDSIDTFIQRTTSNLTFTTGNDTYYVFIYIYNNSAPFTQIDTNIQLEQGSTATSYEPYTGGIAAPNPSYPYMPSRVTGENSSVLQNENLYNKNTSVSEELNGSDGSTSSSNTYSTSDYIRVVPGQDYYLTGKNDGYSNCFYDNNKNFIQTIQKTTGVITVPDNQNIAFIRFNSNKTYKNTIMFIKGSTALTTYVEHEEQNYQLSLGNIELNSSPDGTMRDQIVGKPNEWYKREYIGKVVLDGVNNAFATKSNTNANKVYFTDEINNMVVPSSNNNLGKGLSSHFKLNTAQNVYANDLIGFGIRVDNKINYGFGASSDLTTLALANQWLQEQYNNGTPVTTYYLHVNYVDIPITDTTLISQLNNIYNNAHSYNGVTNITTTYEDGNEQMYLDIEALKNVWEVTE